MLSVSDHRANEKTNLDLTQGSPLKLLTLFTFPALASNLLNQGYTIPIV